MRGEVKDALCITAIVLGTCLVITSGILLIVGYSTSPQNGADFANYVTAQCTVAAFKLLPVEGSDPQQYEVVAGVTTGFDDPTIYAAVLQLNLSQAGNVGVPTSDYNTSIAMVFPGLNVSDQTSCGVPPMGQMATAFENATMAPVSGAIAIDFDLEDAQSQAAYIQELVIIGWIGLVLSVVLIVVGSVFLCGDYDCDCCDSCAFDLIEEK